MSSSASATAAPPLPPPPFFGGLSQPRVGFSSGVSEGQALADAFYRLTDDAQTVVAGFANQDLLGIYRLTDEEQTAVVRFVAEELRPRGLWG
ncbi:hypothetical protein N0V83_008637 [Neocucurbitaria cava]|uniref:Uncharacterized protein n=1 Tax=Neocucurbitaria cava TaxID=798079 RepID=A0A9W8Y125_9PLEO|nr:hypothetical protein N0V83_008637 [Neocucurbitaria cava]